MTAGLTYVVGAAALVLGRKLFWFFVAAVGFGAGLTFVRRFAPGQPEWVFLIAALAAGLLGAVLAIVVQNVLAMVETVQKFGLYPISV